MYFCNLTSEKDTFYPKTFVTQPIISLLTQHLDELLLNWFTLSTVSWPSFFLNFRCYLGCSQRLLVCCLLLPLVLSPNALPLAHSQTLLRLLASRQYSSLFAVCHPEFSQKSAVSSSDNFNHMIVCVWSTPTISAWWLLFANPSEISVPKSAPPPL